MFNVLVYCRFWSSEGTNKVCFFLGLFTLFLLCSWYYCLSHNLLRDRIESKESNMFTQQPTNSFQARKQRVMNYNTCWKHYSRLKCRRINRFFLEPNNSSVIMMNFLIVLRYIVAYQYSTEIHHNN